jgi:hypothetical protein
MFLGNNLFGDNQRKYEKKIKPVLTFALLLKIGR